MLRSQALPGLRKFKVLPSITRLGMLSGCGTLSIGLHISPRHLWPEPRNCLVSGLSLEPHILPQNLSAGIFPSSAASIPNSGAPGPHSSSCLRGWLQTWSVPGPDKEAETELHAKPEQTATASLLTLEWSQEKLSSSFCLPSMVGTWLGRLATGQQWTLSRHGHSAAVTSRGLGGHWRT